MTTVIKSGEVHEILIAPKLTSVPVSRCLVKGGVSPWVPVPQGELWLLPRGGGKLLGDRLGKSCSLEPAGSPGSALSPLTLMCVISGLDGSQIPCL